MLHGEFKQRFDEMPVLGQDFMLDWAKGEYNAAVQQFTVVYDEVYRRNSDSLRSLIERHPITKFQREYVESETKAKIEAKLNETEQRIADLLSP